MKELNAASRYQLQLGWSFLSFNFHYEYSKNQNNILDVVVLNSYASHFR